jgi:hypothetical protein
MSSVYYKHRFAFCFRCDLVLWLHARVSHCACSQRYSTYDYSVCREKIINHSPIQVTAQQIMDGLFCSLSFVMK